MGARDPRGWLQALARMGGVRAFCAAALAVLGLACQGTIGTGIPEEDAANGSGSGSGGPVYPTTAFAPGPLTMHRLTQAQVFGSYRALFGDNVSLPAASSLPEDGERYGFSSIAAAEVALAPRDIELYEAFAYSVLEPVFSDDKRRESLVGCAPAAVDDDCVREFFATFGRRAYRRSLAAEELDALVDLASGVATEFSSVSEGIRFATASVLQSPYFLFRIEIGAADQHLSSISDLEQRLGAQQVVCTEPGAPGQFPDVNGREQMQEKNAVMSELITVALACGLTDAFSIMFSTCGSGVIMWPAGATDGQHRQNHTEDAPYTLQHESVKFTMKQLATFLTRMRDTPEGDSNLLERSSILVCTEHAEGWTHSQNDMPILVCGKGAGRLKGNIHYRNDGGNVSRALLTALRGAGLPLTEFGYEEGLTNSPIGELETGV